MLSYPLTTDGDFYLEEPVSVGKGNLPDLTLTQPLVIGGDRFQINAPQRKLVAQHPGDRATVKLPNGGFDWTLRALDFGQGKLQARWGQVYAPEGNRIGKLVFYDHLHMVAKFYSAGCDKSGKHNSIFNYPDYLFNRTVVSGMTTYFCQHQPKPSDYIDRRLLKMPYVESNGTYMDCEGGLLEFKTPVEIQGASLKAGHLALTGTGQNSEVVSGKLVADEITVDHALELSRLHSYLESTLSMPQHNGILYSQHHLPNTLYRCFVASPAACLHAGKELAGKGRVELSESQLHAGHIEEGFKLETSNKDFHSRKDYPPALQKKKDKFKSPTYLYQQRVQGADANHFKQLAADTSQDCAMVRTDYYNTDCHRVMREWVEHSYAPQDVTSSTSRFWQLYQHGSNRNA